MQQLREDEFEQVVAAATTAVVEFYTDWCPDCRAVEQAYAQYAQEFPAHFARINADEAKTVAGRLGVKGIPTFLVFREGREVARLPSRDAKTPTAVRRFLTAHLDEGGSL